MEAADGWHLSVREGAERDRVGSLWLRKTGRSEPGGNVCEGRKNLYETAERRNSPAPK